MTYTPASSTNQLEETRNFLLSKGGKKQDENKLSIVHTHNFDGSFSDRAFINIQAKILQVMIKKYLDHVLLDQKNPKVAFQVHPLHANNNPPTGDDTIDHFTAPNCKAKSAADSLCVVSNDDTSVRTSGTAQALAKPQTTLNDVRHSPENVVFFGSLFLQGSVTSTLNSLS